MSTLLTCVCGASYNIKDGHAGGAIFGLLGLLAASLHMHRERMIVRDRRLPMVLLVWAVYALINGALSPRVDNLAHAGGFVAGTAARRKGQ